PVTACIEVSQVHGVLLPQFDGRRGARDLSRHEGFAAAGRLVIEQDAVAGKDVVRLPIVDGHPIRIEFRRRVRTPRAKRRPFGLWNLGNVSVHLRAARLIKSRGDLRLANGFEDTNCTESGDITGVLGNVEANADVALRGQMVDFVGLDAIEQLDQVRRIGDVAVVQEQPHVVDVRIAVKRVDSTSVERRGSPNDTVDLVSLLQQEFGKIRSVLTGNAGNQGFFHRCTARSPLLVARLTPDVAMSKCIVRWPPYRVRTTPTI